MKFINNIKNFIYNLKIKYHYFKTEGAGKTMFYGRFRRMELLKKALVVIASVLVLIILIHFVSNKIVAHQEENVDFSYMRNYFKSMNYSCQEIEKSGGKCFLENDATSIYFTRYDEGFYYLIKTDSYSLFFRHIVNTYNDITFTTNENALIGYKGYTYTCYTDDSIFGNLDECITKNDVKLDSDLYLGVINTYIGNLNEIIKESGYDRDSIVNDYYWVK